MSDGKPRRRTAPRRPARPEVPPEPSLVEYAEGEAAATSLAQLMGGLIDANLRAKPSRQAGFKAMEGRVGIEVRDIDEAVTLDFRSGRLVVYNGLRANRRLTVSAASDTVMQLSRLRLGPWGLPDLRDETVREIGLKLLTGQLSIGGLPLAAPLLNQLGRLLSVS